VIEAQVVPARHLLKILSQLADTMGADVEISEKKDVLLPSSHGSTIMNIDIVIDTPQRETRTIAMPILKSHRKDNSQKTNHRRLLHR
jgi:hypothetical protein